MNNIKPRTSNYVTRKKTIIRPNRQVIVNVLPRKSKKEANK